MTILCRRGKFKDTEKSRSVSSIRCIGIGTDIVIGMSVPESTAASTKIPKYRISFGIPSCASYQSHHPSYLEMSKTSTNPQIPDPHVRTPFHISGTTGRIALKIGMWLWDHLLYILHRMGDTLSARVTVHIF